MTAPSQQAKERQAQALELRLAGATYEAIADRLGYANKGGAHKAVQAALEDRLTLSSTDGEDLAVELARLDAILVGLWGTARRGDLQAIDRVLRISERRQQLKYAAKYAATSPMTVDPERTGLSEFERRRQQRRQATG